MDLHTTLIEALNIDYNLAFMGAVCTSQERVKSRGILITVMRKLVEVLTVFVKFNHHNQRELAPELSRVRKLTGALEVPHWPKDFNEPNFRQLVIDQGPGLNVETMILETLRGNVSLCNKIAEDMFDEFATLLDNDPDPSRSSLLQFFNVVCCPTSTTTIAQNQRTTVNTLLNPAHLVSHRARAVHIHELSARRRRCNSSTMVT